MRIYEFRPVEHSERFFGKSCHQVGIVNRMFSESLQPEHLCSLCTFKSRHLEAPSHAESHAVTSRNHRQLMSSMHQ